MMANIYLSMVETIYNNLLNSQVKDCQKICRKEFPAPQSSAPSYLTPLRTITKFMSSIWKLFVFFITNSLFDKGTAVHRQAKHIMCCEDSKTYFRNFSMTDSVNKTLNCGGTCEKNITLTPLPQTNVLLVIDNSPDCLCPKIRRPKKSYMTDLCNSTNSHPVSQWRSDLSQQVCFEKLKSNLTFKETKFKCAAEPP